MIKIGRYMVVSTVEIAIASRKQYDDDFCEYLVIDERGTEYGYYRSQEKAIILAKGLEKNDLELLNKEMERLIVD